MEVGSGDFVAEVQQHLGDAAHADASDADEVNALNFGEHFRSTAWPRIYTDERRSESVESVASSFFLLAGQRWLLCRARRLDAIACWQRLPSFLDAIGR